MSGMKKYSVLAMDFGASSGRGIVGGFDGERITLDEVHRFENAPVNLAGQLVWDVPSLYSGILTSIGRAANSSAKISSLGIDTWGVDYCYLDRHGHMLSLPIHYRDEGIGGAADEFFNIVPWEELYSVTGIQNLEFNTIYRLARDAKISPEIVSCASRVLFIPDLFGYFLTGTASTEYTIASTGAILDAKSRDFARDILERAGIDASLFAPIRKPAAYLGKIKDEVKSQTGFSGELDVVSVASHDTASAVIAVPAGDDDFVYISSGTWSLLGTETKNPLITGDSMKYSFTNEGGAEGTIRVLKNIAGLWLIQESRRQWRREGKNYTFDDLENMARASEPAKFIINPDDETLASPGNMPARIARLCEASGEGVPESDGEIVRAIYDSLALRYRWCVEKINSLRGTPARHIHIVGGGVKERLLSSLSADVCGLPVLAGPVEATAIGNISEQLIYARELSSLSEARSVVAKSFDIERYEPNAASRGMWDCAYERFCRIADR